MIDNASQCTESEALVPIVGRAMHVILFGDTTQLRPHIEDEDAATGGLSVNIFQRMLDASK
jgi:superfamily I DNA and/or RNA helicase